MKRVLVKTALVCFMAVVLCGCGASNVTEFGKKIGSINKEKADVHTVDEMKAFALEQLSEKYSKDFVLEEDTLGFSDNTDNPRLTNDLSGYAHVENDPDDRAYFIVEEPDEFRDNYSFNQYKKLVEKRIEDDLKEAGMKASVEAYYTVIKKTLPDNMSVDKVIADPKCEICFAVSADGVSTEEDFIPIIREWMSYLYSLDYDWYFELIKDGDVIYSLDPSDGGNSKESDWSDESILGHMSY